MGLHVGICGVPGGTIRDMGAILDGEVLTIGPLIVSKFTVHADVSRHGDTTPQRVIVHDAHEYRSSG